MELQTSVFCCVSLFDCKPRDVFGLSYYGSLSIIYVFLQNKFNYNINRFVYVILFGKYAFV